MITKNIRCVMARDGLTVQDVVSASGLNERTVKALLAGTKKPHAKTLHKLAKGLDIEADELFFGPNSLASTFDRQTNSMVQEMLLASPELFEGWNEVELDELFSRFGTGGELNEAGVKAMVQAMNTRRHVFEKIAVLMETDQAGLLTDFVNMLYQRATDLHEYEPENQAQELSQV